MSKLTLWQPTDERIKKSNAYDFIQFVNSKYGLDIQSFEELYDWSVNYFVNFWDLILEYSGIKHEKHDPQALLPKDKQFEGEHLLNYEWFPKTELNFAENLLRFKDDKTALVYYPENKPPEKITYKELNEKVAKLASAMKNAGVQEKDRIAGFINNGIEAVIAMLAASSLGAVWSSTSPDFGTKGVLDRFKQIKPRFLFAVDGYQYNGKEYDKKDVVDEIVKQIPEIEKVVIINKTGNADDFINSHDKYVLFDEFIDNKTEKIEFKQLNFNHPLYIMYSSGTTGLPKSIVHGQGGTLLQHYKELALHTDLSRDDVITYFTTTGWMMWNWLISSLYIGSTIVLIDGSPSLPDLGRLWKIIEDEKITVFGTSPKFLSACEYNSLKPKMNYDLSTLKTILSTGAPLTDKNFQYVYREVKEDVLLSSISGGTDIISCFMLGSPMKPVYSEEIQTRGLGMKVESYDPRGNAVTEEKGELVCTLPFPSMPVYFWNDEDKRRYLSAYFEDYPGVWKHGDYIRITENGGVIVYGRSDATLNPGGIRIGTAEIYRVVEAMDEVKDSLAAGKKIDGDTQIALFVVLEEGIELNKKLEEQIRKEIKRELTPRHIPKIIKQVNDIPHTLNGKKVELAVTNIINGKKVPNKASLANPDCLEEYESMNI